MSELTDRIKTLCEGKGVSIKKFEQDCNLSNGYYSSIRRYNSMPSADKLNTIAQYFGVSRDYLLGKEIKGESVGVMIPLLGRVAAGVPISAVEYIIGQEEISKALAITGEYFALKIKGDSMHPYIMDGDVVVVRQQNTAENGEVVIALINGHDGVCKRFKKLDTGIMLTSVNPRYDPIIFTHSEIDSMPVYIMGKVIEIRRSV